MKNIPKNSKALLKRTLKPYQTLIVAGGNWGDEGKGKVIDLLMDKYDITARFSGGANAGHTVKIPSGVQVISHLIPCGITQNKTCVMGRGELINLKLFKKEFEKSRLALKGIVPPIYIDHMCSLWTPWHSLLESWLEIARGKAKVGTTKKGIAPLEGLYKFRIAPVVGHIFLSKAEFIKMLTPLYKVLSPIFQEMKKKRLLKDPVSTPTQVAKDLQKFQQFLKGKVTDTSYYLHKAYKNKKKIMFEGAQALGLDVHWGTYPFVSSGNSAAAGAPIGSGLPMKAFGATIMVAKTLPTRVGMGPFVSEMWNRKSSEQFPLDNKDLFEKNLKRRTDYLKNQLHKLNTGKPTGKDYANYFQVLGDERGATTRRGRSVGFLDIPWLTYASRINGPNFLALTRFDMLSGVKSIPVVVGYKYKGKKLEPGILPPAWELSKVKPIFQKWQGWKEDIFDINREKDLPRAARNFLAKLEKAVGVPILLVGTGPSRNAMVVRKVKKI